MVEDARVHVHHKGLGRVDSWARRVVMRSLVALGVQRVGWYCASECCSAVGSTKRNGCDVDTGTGARFSRCNSLAGRTGRIDESERCISLVGRTKCYASKCWSAVGSMNCTGQIVQLGAQRKGCPVLAQWG